MLHDFEKHSELVVLLERQKAIVCNTKVYSFNKGE